MKKAPSGTSKRIEKGIYQRGPYSYQVKLMLDGHKICETFDYLEEARAYRDSLRVTKALDPHAKQVLEARVKKRDAGKMTLAKALEKYQEEVTENKKSADTEKYRIAKLKRYDIAAISLYRVSPDAVVKFLGELRKEGLSENSLRKYCALISHLYTVAVKRWRLEVTNPIKQIELPSNGKPRKRRLEGDEEAKLVAELKKAGPYVLPAFLLAVETTMRQSELLGLQWENIVLDEQSGVARLVDTKNGESRDVPLTSTAVEILKELKRLPRSIDGRVFPISKPVFRRAWEKAREKAEAPDLRWHDLRHEGTSRLFELGLNWVEASSITGHKTPQMIKDYTHLRAVKLADKLNRLKQA